MLMIIEYWNFIGQEPFLAITWEPDFSQACIFHGMLMHHKNFCFTPTPDKTNDVIFLKGPKTLFWGHFWPFLVIFAKWVIFQKKSGCHTQYIWAPNTCWVSEKTEEPIPWKLTNRWKDGWKDRHTLFHGTLPAEARSSIRLFACLVPSLPKRLNFCL